MITNGEPSMASDKEGLCRRLIDPLKQESELTEII